METYFSVLRIAGIISFLPSVIANEGWLGSGSYEYWISSQKVTKSSGVERCRAMNAYLTSITNEAESDFIIRQLSARNVQGYWIGLYINESCSSCDKLNISNSACVNNNGHGVPCCNCRRNWKWTDGSQMTYMKWQHSEPTGGQECGRIDWAKSDDKVTDDWFWYDNCMGMHGVICKRRKAAASPDTGEATTSTFEHEKQKDDEKSSNMNIGMVVGITVALILAAVIGIAVILVIILRRRSKDTKSTQHTEKHTYYNADRLQQQIQDSNHEVKSNRDTKYDYVNTGTIRNVANDGTLDTENYDDDMQTGYAEISIQPAPGKPRPLTSKPKTSPSLDNLKYAEIDFGIGSQEASSYVGDESESTGYSSADSLNRKTQISFMPSCDDSVTNGRNKNVNPFSREDQNAAVYAQPVKGKQSKPSAIEHVSSPSNDEVLYAIPDKHKNK